MYRRILAASVLGAFLASTSHAALLGRAPLTPGGTDYRAYYDDVQNVTWIADANLAASNQFGLTDMYSDGRMGWRGANELIAAMNSANYLGASTWRLPSFDDTGPLGCSDNDCGYNFGPSMNEMARLYYSTLGNVGYRDTSGSLTGCSSSSPYCLTNTGPFSNLQPARYWTGTLDYSKSLSAFAFDFRHGSTFSPFDLQDDLNVWAVRSGDIDAAPVPVPAALWLFGGALAGLGWLRHRQIAR